MRQLLPKPISPRVLIGSALACLLLTLSTACTPHLAIAKKHPAIATPAPQLDRVRIGGNDFYLERAETPEQLAQGLMFRRYLKPRHGMRFIFPSARFQSFWMKNTKLPLDMLFIHHGRVVDIIQRAVPCTKNPCPVYTSRQPAEWVIELEGGTAAKYSLQLGDSVRLLPVSTSR